MRPRASRIILDRGLRIADWISNPKSAIQNPKSDDSLFPQLLHHHLGDLLDLVLLQIPGADRAAFRRRLHIAEIGDDALEHALELIDVDPLIRRHRLPTAAEIEAAELRGRAETFG